MSEIENSPFVSINKAGNSAGERNPSEKFAALPMRTNFWWMLAGNFTYGVCQWLFIIVIAKLTSPELLGRFSLGLAVSAPVVMFLNFQIRSVQATDARNEYTFSDFFGLRILTNIAAIAAIAVLSFSIFRVEVAAVILIIGFSKIFESTSDVIMGWFQKIERMDLISKSLMIRGSLSVAGLLAGIYFTGSLVIGVMCLAGVWLMVMVFYDLRNLSNSFKALDNLSGPRPKFSRQVLVRLVSLTFSLGFVTLLVSLNTNIPRYFLEHYLGERELGIFTSMAYLIIVGSKFISALSNVSLPRLSKYYVEGSRRDYLRLLISFTFICAIVGVCAILVSAFAGKFILKIIYRPEYAEYSGLFVWIMAAGAFQYVSTYLWMAMFASRYIRVQTPLNIFYVLVVIGCCFFLIPGYGLRGAAYSIVISSAVQAAGNLAVNVHAYLKMGKMEPR